jgi:uncharacterized protein YggE
MRKSVRVLPALAGLLVPSLVFAQVAAQSSTQAQPPFIAASATGESRVTPDRAVIQVTVDARNSSAGAAGAELRTRQESVTEAIKAAGVAPAQLRTTTYRVAPEYAEPERGKAPKITGYRAANTIRVEVRSVDNIGRVIDAALGAGATVIPSMNLFSSNTDAARREAVQQAVTKARGEAEIAATAAGGTLGAMIEMTIDPAMIQRPYFDNVVVTGAASVASPDGTRYPSPMPMAMPVEPGESLVMASVRVRWQFNPGGR